MRNLIIAMLLIAGTVSAQWEPSPKVWGSVNGDEITIHVNGVDYVNEGIIIAGISGDPRGTVRRADLSNYSYTITSISGVEPGPIWGWRNFTSTLTNPTRNGAPMFIRHNGITYRFLEANFREIYLAEYPAKRLRQTNNGLEVKVDNSDRWVEERTLSAAMDRLLNQNRIPDLDR